MSIFIVFQHDFFFLNPPK